MPDGQYSDITYPKKNNSGSSPVAHLYPFIHIARQHNAVIQAERPIAANKAGIGMPDEGTAVHDRIRINRNADDMLLHPFIQNKLFRLELFIHLKNQKCEEQD
ncbi:Uncharacterised protein [Mycobacteroides abscessus subsp. abscessus]|nr:Uncharacterised protein [Mycobacteroides abscessus subsp. abscessus]